jgi:hypothetical protein
MIYSMLFVLPVKQTMVRLAVTAFQFETSETVGNADVHMSESTIEASGQNANGEDFWDYAQE